MTRVGVFICWCGRNISGRVDIKRLKEYLRNSSGAFAINDYKYLCSEPGQDLISKIIKEEHINAIVVAACSPNIHEKTFRNTAARSGLNQYQCEIANIREQCSWVHNDIEKATVKALEIINATVKKVTRDEPLTPIFAPLKKRVCVIGGGIAGIQTSLDIAQNGFDVVLIEKGPVLGGKMAQLSHLFVEFESASALLTGKIAELKSRDNIQIFTSTEVKEVEGYVGNFKVRLYHHPEFIDKHLCDGCAKCLEVCPANKIAPAIYLPKINTFPIAPVIDKRRCQYSINGCQLCQRICQRGAINLEAQSRESEEEFGALVLTTGYELSSIERIKEYGYGLYADVIDSLRFEALLKHAIMEKKPVVRPSDSKPIRSVVFIQCVGLRNPKSLIPYCSKICCLYTAKQAFLLKEIMPDVEAYVFYLDLRAGGKKCEEFVNMVRSEKGINYLRGRVFQIYSEDNGLVVRGEDTLINQELEIATDMVVLAPPMRGGDDAHNLAMITKANCDEYGFFSEAHPKLRPLESLTSGVFLAGCAQGPKDISETIIQADGVASKISILFASDEIAHEPIVAEVDETICSGCGLCVNVCPYNARRIQPFNRVAEVQSVLCQGCGACATVCPNGATRLKNFYKEQVMDMIEVMV